MQRQIYSTAFANASRHSIAICASALAVSDDADERSDWALLKLSLIACYE